ncbi:hypothetical protein [Pseudomonas nitroreducens]|uniref:hypothetical protein n=1 Tax=Pseudomonas nitroreducens TaxID=46680 RepID=UPI003D2BBD6D
MKAPLRFAFGWVLYLAIVAATNPIIAAIWKAFQEQPLLVPIITAVGGVALLVGLYFVALRPFWSWCDQPRKPNREVPPCS